MPESECTDSNNNLPDFLTPNEIKFIKKYEEYVKTHELKELDSPFIKDLKSKIDSVTQEQINSLRKELMDYIEKNRSDLKISDRFLKELSMDVYLRGFIAREHKNVVEKIVDTMQYLTEKIDGLCDENFPKEFLEFGVNIATG